MGIIVSDNFFIVCFLLSYYLIFISSCNQSIIRLNMHGMFHIQLYFRDSNINFTVLMSLDNQTTWLAPKESDNNQLRLLASSNKSDKDCYMNLKKMNFKGQEFGFNIYFSSDANQVTYLDDYPIFIFEIPTIRPIGLRGQLGLGYKVTDEKYSLLHQYKKKGLINKLAFSFAGINFVNSLFLGGIPHNIIISQSHSYCNVIGLNNKWDCYLGKLMIIDNENKLHSFNLNTSEYSGYMYFDTETYFIFAPPNFMKQLGNNYLKQEMDSRECSFIYLDHVRQYSCYYNQSYLKGTITLVIEDYAYTYDISSFWSCDLDFCDLSIVENPQGNYWVFGTTFLSKHNTLFDHEDERVHFYSNPDKVTLYLLYSNKKIVLSLGVSFILILGIGMNILIKTRKTNHLILSTIIK